MATRYWVGGTGNWDATSTTNWATSSGGSSGASAPTSADNVIFDANSNTGTSAFTVTVTGTSASPSVCNDFTTGGAGGALDGAMTLAFGTTGYIESYGSVTFPASNFSVTAGATTTNLAFKATTTGKTFTTNGVSLGSLAVRFDGVGGAWTLGSAFTSTTTIFILNGTFNTGNYNISAGAIRTTGTGAGIRTVNLGSSTLTLSAATPVVIDSDVNLTFNAGTSQITCSGASPTFAGGGFTFYNVSFTSAASGTATITGANTFNNLTQTSRSATGYRFIELGANQTVSGALTLGAANTAIRRVRVVSDITGTQRTITCNGTLAALADVDFKDINAAGTVATPWTGTRIGNLLGNSNITFTAAADKYWNLAAGGNWSATGWALSSGGAVDVNNFPLAQDKVIIENTGLNTSATITIDQRWQIGELDISTRTNAMTLASGNNFPAVYKNITLSSAVTMTVGTGYWTMFGQGTTQILDVNTATFTPPIEIDIPTGTLQLAENTTFSSTVTLNQGTLDLNDKTLTCNIFSSSNSNTRTIDFGTGNITVTGNNTTVYQTNTATNLTVTGTPVVNFTYSGSTGTRVIQTGAAATENNCVSVNVTAGSDIVSFSNQGRMKNLNFTGFSGSLGSVAFAIGIFGNLTFSSGMSNPTVDGGYDLLATSGTKTITSNGKTIDAPIDINGIGGTFQLADALTLGSTRTLTLTNGTLDLNDFDLSTGLFSSSNSNTRVIDFGTGDIILTGNDATVWNMLTLTGFSYTGTPTVISNYSGSTGTRTLIHGSSVTGTEANALNFSITAGTDTVALTSTFFAKNLNFTGFTGTRTNTTINIFGNLTISSGMTLTAGTAITTFAATSGTQDITSNGKTFDFPVTQNGVGGTVRLLDNLTIGSTRTLTLTNGTLNLNNFNLSTGLFSSNNSNTRVLTLGTGTMTITGSGSTAFDITDGTNLTVNRGTSIINMASASAKTFAGGGKTYYRLNQGGAGILTITGANTFHDITNTTQPATITFPASTTTTVSNFSARGTSGNLISLRSSTTGTQFTLTYVP
jgi:hypothetical protein